MSSQNSDIAYWRAALANELSPADAEEFLQKTERVDMHAVITPRIALWQLHDSKLGLLRNRAVRRDQQLVALCEELTRLFQRETEGEVLPSNAYEILCQKMEATWSTAGFKKKRMTGFIGYRFGWIGGASFARWWTHGWWETWVWAIAAAKKPGMGRTSVLIWSWALAHTDKKGTLEYYALLQVLQREFFHTIEL